MKRFTLLVALLGVFLSPLSRAEEPVMCKSMCATDKKQCAKRAGTLTELDTFAGEEKNPLANTANQMRSETTRSAERSDFMKRKRERLDVCNASYLRCTRACAPAVPTSSERATLVK